jgi:hypothetical protein
MWVCERFVNVSKSPYHPRNTHLRKYKGQKLSIPPSKDGVPEHVTHPYKPEQASTIDLPQPIYVPEIAYEEQPTISP